MKNIKIVATHRPTMIKIQIVKKKPPMKKIKVIASHRPTMRKIRVVKKKNS